MNNYLLQLAIEGAQLHVDETTPAISDMALEDLARQYMNLLAVFDRLKKSFPIEFLDQLLRLPVVNAELLTGDQGLDDWLNTLQQQLNENADNSVSYKVYMPDYESEKSKIVIARQVHGITNEKTISIEFFNSPDYQLIYKFVEQVSDLFSENSYVMRGEKKQSVSQFSELYDWLMREAKKGQTIQRYKGLGEMNPEQLWETTMDPDNRRLLRVRIEDAIAADEVFTTLMGDHVEPRREFIESNALNVSNLDV